jgi:ATP-dependent Lhr-like helicase
LLSDILPARVRGMTPRDLDALCGSGQVVWAGVEPIASNDGRIALYLAEHEALLAHRSVPVETQLAATIRAALERRGAVFFPELLRETRGFPSEVLATLWDMVWSGEVSNDSLEPLRSWLAPRASRRAREARPSRLRSTRDTQPAGSQGRWSLRSARWGTPASDTDRRAQLALSLLDRYGIVTREVAPAEALPGGFSSIYEVLKTMESCGRIRRGYFVRGQGGVQFALPGADEALRRERTPGRDAPSAQLLSAVDPANPYGALLAWPEREGAGRTGRFSRSAGAYVVLYQGVLVAYLQRTGGSLTHLALEPNASRDRSLALAIRDWARSQRLRRALQLSTIDGTPAAQHALAGAFRDAGFLAAGGGLMLNLRTLGAAEEAHAESEQAADLANQSSP